MLAHHLMRVKGKRRSEFIDSASIADSTTITVPSTASPGDIAILVDTAYGLFSTPSAVIPSGWTEFISSSSISYMRICWSWKVLTQGNIGASVTGMPGFTSEKVLAVFRIYNSKRSPSIVSIHSQLTSGNPSSQNVQASNYGYGSITCGYYRTSSNAAWVSGAFDNSNINANARPTQVLLGYKLNNLTNSDNTIDAADNGTNTLGSWLIIDE